MVSEHTVLWFRSSTSTCDGLNFFPTYIIVVVVLRYSRAHDVLPPRTAANTTTARRRVVVAISAARTGRGGTERLSRHRAKNPILI